MSDRTTPLGVTRVAALALAEALDEWIKNLGDHELVVMTAELIREIVKALRDEE